MPAPADVVRVENVQPDRLAVILGCGGEALRREKLLCGLLRKEFLLRVRLTRFNYLVPYAHKRGNVFFLVLSDVHFFAFRF